MRLTHEQMAERVARELRDGFCVNLGRGLPALVVGFIPAGSDVLLQSGNGMLGVGPHPEQGKEDPDLMDADWAAVTEVAGAAYFSSAESFAMIRGGHVDLAVLQALEVSARGDLASWTRARGMGADMDLVSGARRVIVMMEHATPEGKPRIVERCSQPLTGRGCVSAICTDQAWIVPTPDGLLLRELAPGVTAEQVQRITGPKLIVASNLETMGAQ